MSKATKLNAAKLKGLKFIKNFKTPIGELRWVNISEQGADVSMNKDGSAYKKIATGIFTGETADNVIEMLHAVWEEVKAEGDIPDNVTYIPGYKTLTDDSGVETGEVAVKFQTNTHYKDGTVNTIRIYNAKGVEVQLGDRKIGNGSKGVIHGQVAFFYQSNALLGLTLYLKGIQLTKFVPYNDNVIETEDLTSETNDAFEAFEGDVEAVSY